MDVRAGTVSIRRYIAVHKGRRMVKERFGTAVKLAISVANLPIQPEDLPSIFNKVQKGVPSGPISTLLTKYDIKRIPQRQTLLIAHTLAQNEKARPACKEIGRAHV